MPPTSLLYMRPFAWVLIFAWITVRHGIFILTLFPIPSVDENREHLLESGFLNALVTLLERYTDLIPTDKPTDFLPLSVAHLKVVRTTIGVLLNASLGYGASTWLDVLIHR